MEELFLRFPHLSEDIFNALDNKSFANSKEVSKVWYNYLDDQNFVQERKVRMIQKMIEKFQRDFQQKGLRSDVLGRQGCRQLSTSSTCFDTTTVQTILNEARKCDFDMVHSMIMVGFKKAYHPLSYHPIRSRPVPLCIFHLANRNQHEEILKYISMKYVFRNFQHNLNSLESKYVILADCIPISNKTYL